MSINQVLLRSATIFTLGATLLTTPARAVDYAETGDAGDLPGTAQVVTIPVGSTLNRITGTLTLSNGISEADMFQISIDSPSTFSATTTNFALGVNNFDTQLFLFNGAGRGVFANDDTASGPQSTLPANSGFVLTPGIYYLLVDGSGRYPVSTGGLIFPNFTDNTTDPTAVVGPTGAGGAMPISGYTGNSNEGGNYSIQFAVVPEPSTVVATLTGLTGLLLLMRRRHRL